MQALSLGRHACPLPESPEKSSYRHLPFAFQASIVNTDPSNKGGVHWIVVAYLIRRRIDGDHARVGQVIPLRQPPPPQEWAGQGVTAWLVIMSEGRGLKIGTKSATHDLYTEWGAATVKNLGPKGSQSRVLCVRGTLRPIDSTLQAQLRNHENCVLWSRPENEAKRSEFYEKTYLLTKEDQPVFSKRAPYTLQFQKSEGLPDNDKHTSTFILESTAGATAIARMFGLAADFEPAERTSVGTPWSAKEDDIKGAQKCKGAQMHVSRSTYYPMCDMVSCGYLVQLMTTCGHGKVRLASRQCRISYYTDMSVRAVLLCTVLLCTGLFCTVHA